MINIRELDSNDFEVALDLYCNIFGKNKKESNLPLLGTIIGCYLDNELIGLAQIDYINNIFEDIRVGYVNSLCIKDGYRHKGYGTILLNECIKIIKLNGGKLVNLTSNKNRVYAHMLYKKLGLEEVDTVLFKKVI